MSWLGSSRVGFAVEPIIERSHASQSISIITKLVQLGNFVRSSAITEPYFLSLTSIVTDVNARWFKSLFAEYWNLMCAVCQVDMGAPSVGDYAVQLFSSIASLAAPSKSIWFVRISRISSNPRSQTLFKSSNNWTQSFAIIFGSGSLAQSQAHGVKRYIHLSSDTITSLSIDHSFSSNWKVVRSRLIYKSTSLLRHWYAILPIFLKGKFVLLTDNYGTAIGVNCLCEIITLPIKTCLPWCSTIFCVNAWFQWDECRKRRRLQIPTPQNFTHQFYHLLNTKLPQEATHLSHQCVSILASLWSGPRKRDSSLSGTLSQETG